MANKKKSKRPTKSTAKPKPRKVSEKVWFADALHSGLSPIRNLLLDIHEQIETMLKNASQSWTDRAIAMGDAELFEANDALADEIERRGITRPDSEPQPTTEG